MKARVRRRLLPAAGLWLSTLLLTSCGSDPRARANPAVPVTVAQVATREVPYNVTTAGTVEPISTVAVASQVNGTVRSVGFHEGDEVQAGQVLFRIDPRPYENALAQAEGTLARDLVQLENAAQQVERYQSLAQSRDVTPEQFDALRTNARSLAAAVKADSAAVANARLNLDYTTIRAPISGRTGSVLVKEGNLVRVPGTGPLVVINELRPIQVRFAVSATELPLIRRYANDSLAVLAQPQNDVGVPLRGVLTFVDNAVDSTTGTITLKGRFANTDGRLWPGEYVTATLTLYVENALVVPQAAVVNSQQGPLVFVIGSDSLATTRSVRVGRNVDDDVIVTDGLTAGETVVTDGQLRLVAGSRVEIKPRAAEVTP